MTYSSQCQKSLKTEGVEVVVDDLLTWGEIEEQHDSKLEMVLQRAKQHNLKLNKDNSQIRCKGIGYVSYIIGKDGLKPDPRKFEAIVNKDPPKDKKEPHP